MVFNKLSKKFQGSFNRVSAKFQGSCVFQENFLKRFKDVSRIFKWSFFRNFFAWISANRAEGGLVYLCLVCFWIKPWLFRKHAPVLPTFLTLMPPLCYERKISFFNLVLRYVTTDIVVYKVLIAFIFLDISYQNLSSSEKF